MPDATPEPTEADRQALHSAYRAIGEGSFVEGSKIIAAHVAEQMAAAMVEAVMLRDAAIKAVEEITSGYEHHQADGVVFTDKGRVSSRFRTAELALTDVLRNTAHLEGKMVVERSEWERREKALNWIATSGWNPHSPVGENAHRAYDCHCTAADALQPAPAAQKEAT